MMQNTTDWASHERGGNHRGSSGIRHDYICTEVFGRRIDFRFRERMSR